MNAQKEEIAKIMDKLPLKDLSTEAFGGGKTQQLFNDPAWDELSSACLGCGTCTFVCPTCQCYDIKDFNTGNGVIRYRCWDSCMYSSLPKWLTETTDSLKRNASVRDLCTSSCTIPKTTTEFSAA